MRCVPISTKRSSEKDKRCFCQSTTLSLKVARHMDAIMPRLSSCRHGELVLLEHLEGLLAEQVGAARRPSSCCITAVSECWSSPKVDRCPRLLELLEHLLRRVLLVGAVDDLARVKTMTRPRAHAATADFCIEHPQRSRRRGTQLLLASRHHH